VGGGARGVGAHGGGWARGARARTERAGERVEEVVLDVELEQVVGQGLRRALRKCLGGGGVVGGSICGRRGQAGRAQQGTAAGSAEGQRLLTLALSSATLARAFKPVVGAFSAV